MSGAWISSISKKVKVNFDGASFGTLEPAVLAKGGLIGVEDALKVEMMDLLKSFRILKDEGDSKAVIGWGEGKALVS